MPTNTDVTNLKINELTEAQYDTAVQQGVIGANELSVITDLDESIQVSTMPTASATELDKIYQFVGTTDANYTNGYFYKCVSDGQPTPTYSWSNIQVQASSGGLPSQTGNAGKFLTTDGTDASWGEIVPQLFNSSSRYLLLGQWANGYNVLGAVKIGYQGLYVNPLGQFSVSVGDGAYSKGQYGIALGCNAKGSNMASVAIGANAEAVADYAIQLGNYKTNSDANTFKVGNANGNFEMMSADGSIPSDRLIHAINKYSTMPTAASTNEGWIVQFTGTTDSTYTHGHLYECVSDGQNPATYSWTEVSMGGGSSYTAGTGIDITGGVISVTSPTLQNKSTGATSLNIFGGTTAVGQPFNVILGYKAEPYDAFSANMVAVGYLSKAKSGGIAIGASAQVGASNAILLNASTSVVSNNDANTFKVANTNGNFEMMSADGTIPTARLTKVNSTITLTSAGWSSNTQTVNVTGMTATGVVMVSPDPTDQADYTSNGILCTAQASGTLTFTCDTVPSADLSVNVVML